MARKQMNLIFPGKGVDRSASYESQPPYSTPDCQNVRLFETLEGRASGGSRPGTGKVYYDQLGSGNPIQLLHRVVKLATDGFTQVAENFNLTDLADNGWTAVASYSTSLPRIFDPAETAIVYETETAKAGAIRDALDPNIDVSNGYTVEMEIVPYEGVFGGSYVLWAGADDTTPDPYQDGIVAEIIMVDGTDSYSGSLKEYSGGTLQNTWAFTPFVGTGIAETKKFWYLIDGTSVKVYWGGTLLTSQTITIGATNRRVGFGLEATVAGAACMVSQFLVQYTAESSFAYATEERPIRVAASNGVLYAESDDNTMVAVPTSLTLHATNRIRCTSLQNKLYIADHGDVAARGTDGVISGSTLDAASIPDWTALGLNVNDFVVVITNGTGAVVDSTYEIDSIAAGQLTLATAPGDGNCSYYIERGPKVYDPEANTLSLWIATTGQVPTGATLIETYRGRIVMAVGRLWYMSRQFDPDDWDYGASDTDFQRAVAGQNAEAGDIGQKLNALMPHHDDYLVFGCDRSLWVLRGDPAWPGANLGPISQTIGCVGGDAWTEADNGSLVLLAHSGVFAVPAGGSGFPQPLSQKLPRELKNLTKDMYQVSMEYEPYDEGIHIFVYQKGVTHTQWWLDWRTYGFYPQKLPLAQIPFCTYASNYQVQDTTDTLMGCTDGYIRRFSDYYVTDDGTAIDSYVLIGPFKLGNKYIKEGSLEEMVATLTYYSGSVDWSVQVGKTSQDAVLADTLDSGTWDQAGGLQITNRPRVRGESCIVRLDNSGNRPWSVEEISIIAETLDDQRML